MTRLQDSRAVVVGQAGRDLVLRVDDVPPAGGAAPVRERVEVRGGKGLNQAVALAQLGAGVDLVAVVGADPAGDDVLQGLRSDGVGTAAVARRGTTALLVDVVAGDGRRLLEHVPDEQLLTPDDVDAASAVIAAASAVLLQQQQPVASVVRALDLARDALVVADGAPADAAAVLPRVDVLRADAAEAEQLAGRRLPDLASSLRAAEELLARGPFLVVLAAGQAGQAVAWRASPRLGTSTPGTAGVPLAPARSVDATGAGDALTAALAASLLEGLGPVDATRRATAAASVVVERLGGRPALSRALVAEALGRLPR